MTPDGRVPDEGGADAAGEPTLLDDVPITRR
jgi:hypothetical protein